MHWFDRRLITALALIFPIVLAVPDPAASGERKTNPNPRSTQSRFTEETYREAQPLPLPRPSEIGPDLSAPQVLIAPADLPPERRQKSGRAAGQTSPELDEQLYVPEPEAGEGLGATLPDGDRSRSGGTGVSAPQAMEPNRSLPFTTARVTPPAALSGFPYRTIGKLFVRDRTGSFKCSGAVIDRRIVLTAAHCLYDFETSPPRFLDDFEFVPAFDRGRGRFGRWDWDAVSVTESWIRGQGRFPNRADFGILEIRDRRVAGRNRAIGDEVGTLGFSTFDALGQQVTAAGYPGNLDQGERMQRTDGQTILALRSDLAVEIGSFQGGGSSGGPWVIDFGLEAQGQPLNGNFVVGVTSFGRGEEGGPRAQGSSILNGEFLDLYDEACAARRGNCFP